MLSQAVRLLLAFAATVYIMLCLLFLFDDLSGTLRAFDAGMLDREAVGLLVAALVVLWARPKGRR